MEKKKKKKQRKEKYTPAQKKCHEHKARSFPSSTLSYVKEICKKIEKRATLLAFCTTRVNERKTKKRESAEMSLENIED